ncbi:HNH endonuclease [bacterium]|nr:HNH endonuclease [bacterium]
MNQQNAKCLVLNSDYSPLGIISWKKAMVWSIKYENTNLGLEIIDFYKNDFILGANNKKYPIPAVTKTNKYYRINNNTVKFSRKNIYIRDNYTCQYCGSSPSISYLTYDHVIPKSMWPNISSLSPTNWTNIVTACVNCNRKKGSRTPKQANMPLKNLPIAPKKNYKYLPITDQLNKIRSDVPNEWLCYIPEAYL